jgi:hypothetical protein
MNTRLTTLITTAAVTSSLLVACGGGGGGGDADQAADAPEVPASAMVSSDALVNFLKALTQRDDSDPMRMNAIDPPASDTEDPLPLR